MKIKTSRTSPKNDTNKFSSFESNKEGVVEIKLEINLNSFSEDELVNELCLRGDIDEVNKSNLLEAMEVSTDLNDKFEEYNGNISKMSMLDQSKFDYLMQIFSKYSLEEIESKLPL